MEMINNPYKTGMQMPTQMTAQMPTQMPAQAPAQVPYGYPYPSYQAPAAPSGTTFVPGGAAVQTGVNVPGQLPMEESFIENILRLNLGKIATIYMTFENNSEWNAKIFKGRLEAAGRDHIIISDPATGMRFLLLMVNLDYITFDEELKYSPTFGGTPTGR